MTIDFNQLLNTAILAGVNGASMFLVSRYLKKAVEKFERRRKDQDQAEDPPDSDRRRRNKNREDLKQ
jgi:hypothetical protein